MILVTGANGKLGDRIIRNLFKRDDAPSIRAGARSVDKIDKMLASRCTLITADYDKRASLDSAMKRVKVLVFVSGTAANADRIRQHREVIEAAKAAGVQRIVYTSFSNPVPASHFNMVKAHVETERMLVESGIAYTILRNPMYAGNLDSFVAGALEKGVLAMPAAAGKVCYATHDDLAEATARVALEGGHEGKVYELTGTEPVNTADIAAILSELTGRSITGADIPLDHFSAFLGTLGLDAATSADLTSIYAAAAAGEYAKPHGDLAELLGHPPLPLRDYLAWLIAAAA